MSQPQSRACVSFFQHLLLVPDVIEASPCSDTPELWARLAGSRLGPIRIRWGWCFAVYERSSRSRAGGAGGVRGAGPVLCPESPSAVRAALLWGTQSTGCKHPPAAPGARGRGLWRGERGRSCRAGGQRAGGEAGLGGEGWAPTPAAQGAAPGVATSSRSPGRAAGHGCGGRGGSCPTLAHPVAVPVLRRSRARPGESAPCRGGAGAGRTRPTLQNPARAAAGPSCCQSRPSRRQSRPARPGQVSPRRQRGPGGAAGAGRRQRRGAGPGCGRGSRCGSRRRRCGGSGAGSERAGCGAGRMRSGAVAAAAAALPRPAPLPPALPARYFPVLGSTSGRWRRGRGGPRAASCAPRQLWVWRQRSGKRSPSQTSLNFPR